MHHELTLISTVAAGFVLAFVFGFIATKCRLPPLVGYLFAGILVGPKTPGFVADGSLATQLAEIGVMLLMFGVGLHFSLGDLLAVRRVAIPGAVGQILVATLMGAGVMLAAGWQPGGALVMGLSLSVASTVVLLKALEERGTLETPGGRITVGWLIVEDLAMVLSLVMLPALAPALGGHTGHDSHHADANSNVLWTFSFSILKVAAFVAVALVVGPRLMPWILRQAARTGSRELFTLAVLASALGIAFGAAKIFGVSFALGAFFAGMVMHESELSHKAASNSLPFQDAFAVLFFVSVGMLFDPAVLWTQPLLVLATLAIVLVGKSLAAWAIVWLLGFPASSGLMVAAALAQIGEFSFILAGLGIFHGLLEPASLSILVSAAIASIALNPLVFHLCERIARRIAHDPGLRAKLEDARHRQLDLLERELAAAGETARARAAAHRTFTPEELAERFPLFAGLTPEQREVLVVHFEPVEAPPGTRVIRAGEKADKVYFVAEGEVEVQVGERRIVLGPGDYFGEMALLSGAPRSADVTSTNFSRFATLSRRDFQKFLQRFPAVRESIASLAAQRGEMNRQLAAEGGTAGSPDGDGPA